MDEIGSNALLAKSSGRFNRLTTAIKVSHFAMRTYIMVKRLAKPKASRNITENTPRKSRTLIPEARTRPFGIPNTRPKMTRAWIMPLTSWPVPWIGILTFSE